MKKAGVVDTVIAYNRHIESARRAVEIGAADSVADVVAHDRHFFGNRHQRRVVLVELVAKCRSELAEHRPRGVGIFQDQRTNVVDRIEHEMRAEVPEQGLQLGVLQRQL